MNEVNQDTQQEQSSSAERVRKYRLRHKDEIDADKQAKKARKIARQGSFKVTESASKSEAYKCLEERGVLNPHILDTVYELGLLAAEKHSLTTNRFFWSNGLVQALRSAEAHESQPLIIEGDDYIPGELISRKELYAIYDYVSDEGFDEWLAIRRRCKTDCFYLAKDILGKDMHELHKDWFDNFYPKLNPDLLKPNYTQEELKAALHTMSGDIRMRVMLSSRGAYKSSVIGIYGVHLTLVVPDVRLLFCSATKSLSKGFIRAYRNYWIVRNPRDKTRFQTLFPEYMITGTDSELTFESPMAHLGLIESTAESTSTDSQVAGARTSCLICDDFLSNITTGNEEIKQATSDKFEMMCKLLDARGSLGIFVIGTPYSPGDLYAQLKARAAEPGSQMIFRSDPAWTVKTEAKHKSLKELEESDVVLAFKERLSWSFLQGELKASEFTFRSQNLLEWAVPEGDLRVTFLEDDIRKHIKPVSFFDNFKTVMKVVACDPAFSAAKTADYSAIVTARIALDSNNRYVFIVEQLDMDRYTQSMLAIKIVQAIHEGGTVQRALVERTGPWEALQAEIQRQAMLRSYILPHIFFKPVVGNSLKSKMVRIKGLEPLLLSDSLWFISGAYVDALIDQFIRFDGLHRSNTTRKDDGCDAIGLAVEAFLPRTGPQANTFVEAEKNAREAALRAQTYTAIFGSPVGSLPMPTVQPDPPSRGRYGIPGLRG